MLTVDRVAGGALALVALVVIVESRSLPFGSLHSPGPAWLPIMLSLLLLVFGAALILTGGRSVGLAAVGWRESSHAAAILTGCAFAALMLERLGYRLTVALVLVFLLAAVERKGALTSVAFAAVLAYGTFFLFDTILRVPLPRGPWGL